MTKVRLSKIIFGLYQVLFFLTPLVFCLNTYELFEFPKLLLVYGLTILIFFFLAWQRLHFPRESVPSAEAARVLGLIILGFFCLYSLATVFSSHPPTSFWGYYTRGNGGWLSLMAYLILALGIYLEYSGQLEKLTHLWSGLLPASLVVSGYALAQHWGWDKDLWIQNAQARVFSTLGQPNWLAAWLAAVIPINLALLLQTPLQSAPRRRGLSALLLLNYAAFWFTYSLSGLAGLAAALGTLVLLLPREVLKREGRLLITLTLLSLAISFLQPGMFGERLRSTWGNLQKQVSTIPTARAQTLGEDFQEKGSTVNIRLAVWQGSLKLIRQHWLLGTGPETFAYSFLPYRPASLNYTTEWDFLYNKAHNEYLNLAAGIGVPGLIVYLLILPGVFSIALRGAKGKQGMLGERTLIAGLTAGWASLWVTNFLGFSVVATNLLFWLIPALILALGTKPPLVEVRPPPRSDLRKLTSLAVMLGAAGLLLVVGKIFWADVQYAQGLSQEKRGQYVAAALDYRQAVDLNSREPAYWRELAYMYTKIAEEETAHQEVDWAALADLAAQKAYDLNPNNSLTLKSLVRIYSLLALARPEAEVYPQKALTIAQHNVELAPTDPKAYYNLGLMYLVKEDTEEAKQAFQKALALKNDYLAAQKELKELP